MNKIENSIVNGAILGSVVMLILEIIRQNHFSENPHRKFDFKRLAAAGVNGLAIGGVIGGATATLFPAEKKMRRQEVETVLTALVSKIKLNKNDIDYQKLDKYAYEITDAISRRFGHLFKTSPRRLGSTENDTALKEQFDIDVLLSFQNSSFPSTSAMFFELRKYLDTLNGKHGITGIRNQRKSIGLSIDVSGNEYKIDIIPCKITHDRKGKTSGYLYVNNHGSWSKKSTYTKTDIGLLKSQRLSAAQKKILIILKRWKSVNDLPISSHLLQRLVIEGCPSKRDDTLQHLSEKVITVIGFIALSLPTLFLSSIENTNNIITNIPEGYKRKIVYACEEMIRSYQRDETSILKFLNS